MNFLELTKNHLIELVEQCVPMNIISLINTINQCDDVEKVFIDKNCYDHNTYAIDIDVKNGEVNYYDYTIWYRYINTDSTILIIGIRNSYCHYFASVERVIEDGCKHNFTKKEKEYVKY